jgi:hypothetical protein
MLRETGCFWHQIYANLEWQVKQLVKLLVESMFIPSRQPAIPLIGATFLLLPTIVFMAFALEDEAEYESWERCRKIRKINFT